MYYNNPIMDGHDTGWGVWMMAFWLIVLVAIIYVVVKLLNNHVTTNGSKHDPIDIAKERYAKGEITKDQFSEIKKELK